MKRSVLVPLAFLFSVAAQAQEAEECPNPKDWRPTEAELRAILQSHEEWLGEESSNRAELCNADLSGMNLSRTVLSEASLRAADLRNADLSAAYLSGAVLTGAYLRQADLGDADLSGANLSGTSLTKAILTGTVLSGAHLTEADLTGAILIGADLREADLRNADLSGAYLLGADLSKASLSGVDLRGANLTNADLSKADLGGADLSAADLSGTVFEPAAGTLPPADSISEARGLSALRYGQPRAIVNMRKLFRDAGYREQEREVTYALEHLQTMKKFAGSASDIVDGAFNFLLFELTTQWGMAPARALWILGGFILVFTPAYWLALVRPGADGIWRIWSKDRRRRDLGTEDGTRPIELRGLRAWRAALYFSLLSAFHIGWRDLNVGNWIARIQRYEFTYRATGWARTVSGIQSLLSVYLLAIWALTYFGRPFE